MHAIFSRLRDSKALLQGDTTIQQYIADVEASASIRLALDMNVSKNTTDPSDEERENNIYGSDNHHELGKVQV